MTPERRANATREALTYAIARLEADERSWGYISASCILATWRQVLQEFETGAATVATTGCGLAVIRQKPA